jgi:transposase
MAAQRKYPEELRDRAVKMVSEIRERDGKGHGELARVGRQLGVHPEALRSWVKQAEIDGGERPGTTTGDKQRIAELERENRELRRANEILKAASAYFARELDPRLPRQSSSLTRTGAGSVSSRPARSWVFPCRRTTSRRNARQSRRRGMSVMPC